MATQYLVTNSLGQAEAQSRNYWEKILGRPKKTGDHTEFMSQCEENPIDHKGIITIFDAEYQRLYPLLTPSEKAFADANLKPITDQYYQDFRAAVEAASQTG